MPLPEKPALEGLEAKWIARWEETGVYRFDRARPREEVFSIDTPPPTVSGSLHVGHVFSYTHTDLVARFQRMRGKAVFYPMGWDDNGLPTERRVQNYYGVRCDPSLAYDPSFTPPPVPAPTLVLRAAYGGGQVRLVRRSQRGGQHPRRDQHRDQLQSHSDDGVERAQCAVAQGATHRAAQHDTGDLTDHHQREDEEQSDEQLGAGAAHEADDMRRQQHAGDRSGGGQPGAQRKERRRQLAPRL